MKKRLCFLVLTAVVSASFLIGCGSSAQQSSVSKGAVPETKTASDGKTIKVGVIGPVTGGLSLIHI